MGARLLVVVLCHSDQFDVAFAVGHFHDGPQRRLAQWKAPGMWRTGLMASQLSFLLTTTPCCLLSTAPLPTYGLRTNRLLCRLSVICWVCLGA